MVFGAWSSAPAPGTSEISTNITVPNSPSQNSLFTEALKRETPQGHSSKRLQRGFVAFFCCLPETRTESLLAKHPWTTDISKLPFDVSSMQGTEGTCSLPLPQPQSITFWGIIKLSLEKIGVGVTKASVVLTTPFHCRAEKPLEDSAAKISNRNASFLT